MAAGGEWGWGGSGYWGGGRAPGRECFPGAPAPCRSLPHPRDSGYLGRDKALRHRAAAPSLCRLPGDCRSHLSGAVPRGRAEAGQYLPSGRGKHSPLSQHEWLKLAAYCTASQWVPAGLPSLPPHPPPPAPTIEWIHHLEQVEGGSPPASASRGRAGRGAMSRQTASASVLGIMESRKLSWRTPPCMQPTQRRPPALGQGAGREGANK